MRRKTVAAPRKGRPKKHPKLPNGYGSIVTLSGNRRRPFLARPPVMDWSDDGLPIYDKPIGYYDDWMEAFQALSQWHTQHHTEYSTDPTDLLIVEMQGLLARYGKTEVFAPISQIIRERAAEAPMARATFTEVYEAWWAWKYEDPHKTYSESSKIASRAAYRNSAVLHNRVFRELLSSEMQAVLDACPKKHASLELMLNLYKQLYKYALMERIVDRDEAQFVHIKQSDDDEPGVSFTVGELETLWAHSTDETVEVILILCYSGFRISALKTLKVNMDDWYFQGGVKTASGKNRIVPIHRRIRPLVERRMDVYGELLPKTITQFRNDMYAALEWLGIEKHTPHDCRDTFATMLDRKGADPYMVKRLMGHSLAGDITQDKYIKKDIEDLRAVVELLD